MNKSELTRQIAQRAGLSNTQAAQALDAMIETVTEELAKGGQISLIGFGTFKTADRAERTGRNPQTGETVVIPAAKVPRFTPGKTLKNAVNS